MPVWKPINSFLPSAAPNHTACIRLVAPSRLQIDASATRNVARADKSRFATADTRLPIALEPGDHAGESWRVLASKRENFLKSPAEIPRR